MRDAFIVCYDVADPKRWRAVHKLMLAYGEPLQLSVYLCHLSPTEYQNMLGRLLQALDRTEDALAVANLGRQGSRTVETYGRARWEHGKRVVVV